jgi:cyanophycin synthetase
MAAKSSRKRKPAAKPSKVPNKAGPASSPKAPRRAPNAPATQIGVTLAKDARLMAGCGFGIDQSVFIGAFTVGLPSGFDLAAIEPLLAEFAIAPPASVPPAKGMSPEMYLVARIHAWHAAIQRGLNVPVFGGCRVWDKDAGQIGFAVPSHARGATVAALQFVGGAIVALALGKADDALPVLRKRYVVLRQVLARHALIGLNSMHFIEAAHKLKIEHSVWVDQIWAYGQGRHRLLLNSSVTSATPQIGVSIAKDKLRCSAVLRSAGLPVADSGLAHNVEAAVKIAQHLGYPVVVKPSDMDQGAGVTAGIEDEADLRRAFETAAKASKRIMVEKHHTGRDYRVTVLHGKVIKIMDRRPGGVTGDGTHTVAQLVDLSNARDRAMRAQHGRQRAPMRLDEEALKLLTARGFAADSVLPNGEFVALRRRANISAGGTYQILPPETLHPDNRMLAVNAALALGLDVAGIDVISGDPTKSWRDTGGIIVEVNAQPQIGYRDTEALFGEILVALMRGKGDIPVHLLITQDGLKPLETLPQLAASAKCNAASGGTNAWIAGAGVLGPFANSLRAGKSILIDRRVQGALIAMSESDVLRLGLPAAHFASIRLVGHAEWEPSASLQQLISGHSPQIVRQHAGRAATAAA